MADGNRAILYIRWEGDRRNGGGGGVRRRPSRPFHRHPELVSGSIRQPAWSSAAVAHSSRKRLQCQEQPQAPGVDAEWMLKQVQHDEAGEERA